MKLLEVEKDYQTGLYYLTLCCSSCGVQLTNGYSHFGVFDNRNLVCLLLSSKYCMFCGHKWNQDKIRPSIDICELFGIKGDDVNDEALGRCLKMCRYLPENFNEQPKFKTKHHGDSTGGHEAEHWVLVDDRSLERLKE